MTAQLQSIKNLIDTFKQVFHKDWSYSSAMLSEETFRNEMGTFLEGKWITNWCNRDELIKAYNDLKTDFSRNNVDEYSIKQHLQLFLKSFEEVFHNDWEYTKTNLGIENNTEKTLLDIKLGLEIIYVIANDGTFLHPNLTDDELEMTNWGYRELLLRYYKEVKLINNKDDTNKL